VISNGLDLSGAFRQFASDKGETGKESDEGRNGRKKAQPDISGYRLARQNKICVQENLHHKIRLNENLRK